MLYFVATPIGNMDDITLRALETFKSVDVIACEDTRNTLKLLNHFDINKKLISYHKFNENSSADGIIKLLQEGKNVAVVSDGGMPLISDPGYVLSKTLKEQNIPFTVIPGANAALCALILSGLDTSRFTFVGFLPEKQKDKEDLLLDLRDLGTVLIFHIACHNIKKDLEIIHKMLGARRASLVKEITKIHESCYDFTLGEQVEVDERGEFVLVVDRPNKSASKTEASESDLTAQVQALIDGGISKKEAIKIVAKSQGLKKDDVYKLFI